jgi:hypothetical protein
MNYNELYDRLMNIGGNAPFSEKKEALRYVTKKLVDNEEPDFLLRLRAQSTYAALDVPELQQDEVEPFVNNEIRELKKVLKAKLGDADEEMEGARRKRRRGKKSRKSKKSGRYTRRR